MQWRDTIPSIRAERGRDDSTSGIETPTSRAPVNGRRITGRTSRRARDSVRSGRGRGRRRGLRAVRVGSHRAVGGTRAGGWHVHALHGLLSTGGETSATAWASEEHCHDPTCTTSCLTGCPTGACGCGRDRGGSVTVAIVHGGAHWNERSGNKWTLYPLV